MSIYQGLICFGQKDEDFGGTMFQWGRLLSKAPKDIEGNKVNNPASVMMYGARGIKSGEVQRIALISRGIPGLYDFVQPDSLPTVLEEMDIANIKDLPEIPVIESETTTISDEERQERRRVRRQKRLARSSSAQEESVQHTEITTVTTPQLEEVVPE